MMGILDRLGYPFGLGRPAAVEQAAAPPAPAPAPAAPVAEAKRDRFPSDSIFAKGNPYEALARQSWGTYAPPMNGVSYPTDPKKPLAGTVNNNFWNWTRSGLNYYFDPDSIGVSVYEEMYTTDETCYAAMEFLTLATLAKFGGFRHENQAIENDVNEWLANLQTPWKSVLRETMSACWAGHSCGEITCQYNGRQIIPTHIQHLPPATISYDLWLEGPLKNQLRAARQWRYGTYSSYLPAEKIIVYSHAKRWGNIYGYSRFRSCWRSWFVKAKMLSAWATVLDRYGSPHAVATVRAGSEETTDPTTGLVVSILPHVTNMLDQLAVNGSVAVTEDIKIELHQAKQAVGNDFGGFIDYLDKMIFRGCLIPSLVGDHGSNGSFALGSKHYDLFVLMLEQQASDLNTVFIDQLIKPLIVANFGPQKSYGHFIIEDFKQEDEKIISEAFKNLVMTGVLKPQLAEDLNMMRERVGATPLTQAQIDELPAPIPDPTKKAPEMADPGSTETEGQELAGDKPQEEK